MPLLLVQTLGLKGNGRGADRHLQEGGARQLAAALQVTASLGPSPLQYFVFDFHVSPDVMFDKIIKISVSGEQSLAGGALSSNCTFVQT